MHITYGVDPKLVDDDVRFRTTYYFRTFDYCWDADVMLTQFQTEPNSAKTNAVPYRRIIPKTDSLYRYRMTGQASALFSRIRFESGVLKASAIDPFGTQISYSREADGFYVRSNSEVKADAEAAAKARADNDAALDKLQTLTSFYQRLPPDTTADIRAAALATIVAALEDYRKAGISAVSSAELARVQSQLDELKAKLGSAVDLATVQRVSSETIESVRATLEKTAFNQLGVCPVGGKIRKGFQIMGPEGIKTFDQDDRLIMAMSTSAKPLVETLQEYSGRILENNANPAAQLLAIANENLRAETARRTLSDAARAKPEPVKLLDDAISAFSGTQKEGQ